MRRMFSWRSASPRRWRRRRRLPGSPDMWLAVVLALLVVAFRNIAGPSPAPILDVVYFALSYVAVRSWLAYDR